MPQAVTHILVVLILLSLFKDWIDAKYSNKKKFSLHYVLIAGLGGVLPDIDIPISFLLNFLGSESWNIHQLFTHSIIFPATLFVLFLMFLKSNREARICNIGKHNLKLSLIFLMLAIGSLTHITLDTIFPIIISLFPIDLQSWIIPTLDGILLVLWIIYLELRHKISDFI